MRVIDLQSVRVLIGQFRLQGRDDQFVIAFSSQMYAAILKGLNREFRSFFDAFGKGFVFFQVPVVCSRGTLDHLPGLHDVAGVHVLIDKNGTNVVVPLEIVY